MDIVAFIKSSQLCNYGYFEFKPKKKEEKSQPN